MKAHKLNEKSSKELYIILLNLLREQFNLRIQVSNGKLQQTHLLKSIRRNIARIKTLLTEKAGI